MCIHRIICRITCECSESAQERRIALYKSDQHIYISMHASATVNTAQLHPSPWKLCRPWAAEPCLPAHWSSHPVHCRQRSQQLCWGCCQTWGVSSPCPSPPCTASSVTARSALLHLSPPGHTSLGSWISYRSEWQWANINCLSTFFSNPGSFRPDVFPQQYSFRVHLQHLVLRFCVKM